MKTRLLALAVCGLMPLTASAQEKKDAVIKEIPSAGLKTAVVRDGDVTKPAAIKSADELAKAFPDEGSQAAIKKHVDFAGQQILFFHWAGSGGDTLSAGVTEGKNEVVFRYARGLTKDLRQHVHLFVLPKDATWKVENKR
jgi:hypothetical protein